MSAPVFQAEVAAATASSVSVSSVVVTLTADVVGNLLVLGWESNSPAVTSAVDSRGNTWSVTNSILNTNRLSFCVAAQSRKLKTGDTITLTLSGTATRYCVSVLDYSNAHLAVDASVFAIGTSTAPASGNTAATTVADEVVIGATVFNGPTADWTVGAGYTQRGTKQRDGTGSLILEEKVVSATGVQASSATLANSAAWCQAAVCIRGSTRWYVDYNKADDTGAGTSWATAKKNLSAITFKSGDLITMAKSTDPSALTGTMTFTDNSTSVSTSNDLTASLAAKDLIGPYTGSDVIAGDGWWEVASLTASTITLAVTYVGTTRTSVTGYKHNGFDAGAPATTTTDIAASAAVTANIASPITIVGGYDTGLDSRTGITMFRVSGATSRGRVNLANAGAQMSYFGLARATSLAAPSNACGCSHFTMAAMGTNGISSNVNFNGNGDFLDSFFYAKGAGIAITLTGISDSITNGSVMGDVSSSGAAVNLGAGSDFGVIDTVVVKRPGNHGIAIAGFRNEIRNCTVSFAAARGISLGTGDVMPRVINCTLSNNTTADVLVAVGDEAAAQVMNCAMSSTTTVSASTSTANSDRHNQTAGSYRRLTSVGSWFANTADARTGTCVEMQPNVTINRNSVHAFQFTTPIPVDASGGDRVVSVYIKTSSTWNGTVLRVGIRQHGQFTSVVDHSSQPLPVRGTWTRYSFSFLAMAEKGAIDLCVECDGTAGSVYVDDVAYT